MPTLNASDTKNTCQLAYTAETGEHYIFADGMTWTVLDHRATWTSGFKAVLLRPQDESKNVTVLSFAGTDSLLDVGVDIKQLFNGLPRQYRQAMELTLEYRPQYQNLYLTGHSLGGGLAAYCSVATLIPASTINPAPLVGAMSLRSLGGNRQITNYIPRKREVVSSSPGRNPGTDVLVEADGNYLTRHKVDNVMPGVAAPRRTGGGASGSW